MNVSNQTVIEVCIQQYKSYLMHTGKLSQASITEYMRDLNPFVEYLNRNYKQDERLSLSVMTAYVKELEDKGLSAATRSKKISCLKGFTKWMMNLGILQEDVMEGIVTPKVEVVRTEIEDGVLDRLLLAIPMKSEKDFRDRAMLSILAWTGLKVTELIELKNQDFLPDKESIVISDGTEIKLSRESLNALKAWIQVRDDKSQYLFPNNSGELMSRQGFWKCLKQRAKNANIPEDDITATAIRQSLVTKLLKEGYSVEEVKVLLRYKSDAIIRDAHKKIKEEKFAKALEDNNIEVADMQSLSGRNLREQFHIVSS